MKGYNNYKESGIQWIGKIPNDWEVIKLKWITQIKRGASPRPIEDLKYFDENGEFSWVRIADVSASERYLENTKVKLSELGASLSVKQYPGDFFLSIAGSVGKPIITKIKCCLHDGFVWFPELKINPEYLYYIFQTGLPFIGLGKIGTQLNLNTETIGNIVIPNLSNKDIQKIVLYLDYKTNLIDATIEKKKRLIELLKEKRQAVINEAVTKGLNPNVPMKDSGVEWLGKIPKNWMIKKLKHIKSNKPNAFVDGPFGSNLKMEHFIDNGEVYVIESGFITSGNFEYKREFKRISLNHFETISRSECNEDDIILAKIGANYGMSAILPRLEKKSVVSGNSLKLSVDTLNNDLKFIHLYILFLKNSGSFELIVNESAQPALSLGTLNNIRIAIPNKEEQIRIREFIKKNNSIIDKLIFKIEENIEKLQAYRQSLISEAVTGKIDVRDWQA
jgi:type I restriction enzyme S subunit